MVIKQNILMKKRHIVFSFILFSASCLHKDEKKLAPVTGVQPSSAQPFKASYSSSFNDSVSDADLNTVLMTYKNWADGKMETLAEAFADSLIFDSWTGEHLILGRGDLITLWANYRDSLSSVVIDMYGWQKSHSIDKNEDYIYTWFKETDTYKNGKVDVGELHDINHMKNGKIIRYSQFRRQIKQEE